MNNFIKLLFLSVLIFGGYKWFNSETNIDVGNWKPYKFNLENVKVKFPTLPKVDQRTALGFDIEYVKSLYINTEYIVTIMQGGGFAKKDFYPHSFTKKGATLLSTTDINIGGYTGKEFKLDFKGKLVIQRLITLNNSLISQISIFKKKDFESANIQGFLDSLTLQ